LFWWILINPTESLYLSQVWGEYSGRKSCTSWQILMASWSECLTLFYSENSVGDTFGPRNITKFGLDGPTKKAKLLNWAFSWPFSEKFYYRWEIWVVTESWKVGCWMLETRSSTGEAHLHYPSHSSLSGWASSARCSLLPLNLSAKLVKAACFIFQCPYKQKIWKCPPKSTIYPPHWSFGQWRWYLLLELPSWKGRSLATWSVAWQWTCERFIWHNCFTVGWSLT